jgi:hypothetical protein
MPGAVFIDGLLPVGVCGHHATVYRFVTMQLTDSESRCQASIVAILRIVLSGYVHASD